MKLGSSIKEDKIVIIGKSLIFKCKLTDLEDVRRACFRLSLNEDMESFKGWSIENLKNEYDKKQGENVPTECTLVYHTVDVNCTIKNVAEKFKQIIR